MTRSTFTMLRLLFFALRQRQHRNRQSRLNRPADVATIMAKGRGLKRTTLHFRMLG
jgi:hypothetical protein